MVIKILIAVLVVLMLIQLIPIKRENPPVEISKDFFSHVEAPEEVKAVIIGACYDCHSYETSLPWYTYLAPVSWWLKSQIEEGREHLNFSVWGDYNQKEKAHKMEEAHEEVDGQHMPLKSYAWMHKTAQLSDEQRAALVEWFKEQQNQFNK
jgi:uncharacterized membrane protein